MIRYVILSITLLLSGCVHLDEYIQINRDGSAKLTFSYSIDQKGLPLLKDCEAVLQELNGNKDKVDLPRFFDANKLKAHFKKFPGVELISVRVTEDKGRIETYVNLLVNDFRASLRQGLLPYTSLEKDGDNYVFAARYPYDMSKMKLSKTLLQVIKSIEFNLRVKTPTPITKSTAHKQLVNLASWSFSPKAKSFDKAGGKYSVHFEGQNLTFLDKK
ncbi:MAG: hypothetical protein HRT88_13870 [Lentisphaeraceae bacterium]|nr:hypothetical protein [Lentisphaeraceae bacterium]